MPEVIPQTIPVEDPTDTDVLDEDHTPPGTLLVSVTHSLAHIFSGPNIVAGVALTVSVFVTVHPVTP